MPKHFANTRKSKLYKHSCDLLSSVPDCRRYLPSVNIQLTTASRHNGRYRLPELHFTFFLEVEEKF